MRRSPKAAIALALLLAAPAAARGETLTLSSQEAVARSCEQHLLADRAPGAARIDWAAPGSGYLSAELRGGRASDWDLAAFPKRGGEPLATSTSFTSREHAVAWVGPGEQLAIQACRRTGERSSVTLRLDFDQLAPSPARDERIAMVSVTLTDAAQVIRLERLGFDVTHDVEAGAASVLTYSDDQRAKLRHAGFEFFPLIRDVAAADAADRAAEAQAAADVVASALPSGRDSYRTYNDYTSEMKALVDANPTLVRSLQIGETLEGRPIEGVEIAADVNRTDDGRPVFLNFGAHHAREWPSAELPMEFALELVARWNAGDPRVRSLLDRVRVVTVPVVNVDGFLVSRNANNGVTTPVDDDPDATLAQIVADSGAYKRKNCRPTDPAQANLPCAQRTGSGVDLNRNYGAYWGGPGSSTDTTTQSYRGTGPYSEPESDAVHRFTAAIHPMVFISNHTFTEGRWLRQPGFDAPFLAQVPVPGYTTADCGEVAADGGAIAPDEPAMDDLGDDMAAANGWISELGYETLCDITGATEDWNYFSQGTYGYTPEIRGPNFHANYAEMVVGEYSGGTASNPLGIGESYMVAAERAANPAEHSVIEGTAPAGATLTLRKGLKTPTCESAECPLGNGPPIDDVLETKLTAPADGTYEWHVNPSGRPLFPAETYTMSCQAPGGPLVTREVSAARGQRVTEDFAESCAVPAGGGGGGGGDGTGGDGAGGGAGADEQRFCRGERATTVGTPGDDVLRGTPHADVIYAGGGADEIQAGDGADLVCAGGGQDEARGERGGDELFGGTGNDELSGGSGRDRCADAARHEKVRSCS